MTKRKDIWDTLDRLEGRKDSSYEALQKEVKRQGLHGVLKTQAGTRMLYTMTNGRMRLTSHYSNREEFLARLAEKNEGGGEWHEIINQTA